jgi:hypothetical protein
MLWEEKTASTDSVATEDMSVMVPTKSGLTDSSMSKRSSFQSGDDKAFCGAVFAFGTAANVKKSFHFGILSA